MPDGSPLLLELFLRLHHRAGEHFTNLDKHNFAGIGASRHSGVFSFQADHGKELFNMLD